MWDPLLHRHLEPLHILRLERRLPQSQNLERIPYLNPVHEQSRMVAVHVGLFQAQLPQIVETHDLEHLVPVRPVHLKVGHPQDLQLGRQTQDPHQRLHRRRLEYPARAAELEYQDRVCRASIRRRRRRWLRDVLFQHGEPLVDALEVDPDRARFVVYGPQERKPVQAVVVAHRKHELAGGLPSQDHGQAILAQICDSTVGDQGKTDPHLEQPELAVVARDQF